MYVGALNVVGLLTLSPCLEGGVAHGHMEVPLMFLYLDLAVILEEDSQQVVDCPNLCRMSE